MSITLNGTSIIAQQNEVTAEQEGKNRTAAEFIDGIKGLSGAEGAFLDRLNTTGEALPTKDSGEFKTAEIASNLDGDSNSFTPSEQYFYHKAVDESGGDYNFVENELSKVSVSDMITAESASKEDGNPENILTDLEFKSMEDLLYVP